MHFRFAFLAIALFVFAPVYAVTDADRTQVYREFRTLFDAHRYQEALPVAEKLVTLTEEQYGTTDRALVNPLANLGTTQRRLGDHQAAEQSYLRSVQILESTASPTDAQLLQPLRGLGATYAALNQHEDAVTVLRRAVDLSRNLHGLFNLEQLPALRALIDSYIQLGQFAEAEKEHQYAFRIAETAYGSSDPRLLEPLDRYARWYEFIGRYTTARVLHARALSIAERAGGKSSPMTVDALRGIARSYRLEFINGPEESARERNAGEMPTANEVMGLQRLNPDGERALELALHSLDSQQPVDHKKRGETLIDLGDWQLASGATPKALDSYRKAWQELNQSGSVSALGVPRQLAYKPPSASVARSKLDPEDAVEQYVEVSFTVTREGRTADIKPVSSDTSESLQKAVVAAVRKARFAPRVENGEPVETRDVRLRERLAVRKSAAERSS